MSADPPLFIEPPEIQMVEVQRMELREALRLSKKFGRSADDDDAFLYSTSGVFFLQVGSFRKGFPLKGEWTGCVSLRAQLLVSFWNALPKGESTQVRYERGWLHLGALALGRAVWQPKHDPEWMND